MSLDIYLETPPIDLGSREPFVAEVHWQNYTHNVTPMWRKAGCYEALYESHGKMAKETILHLGEAIKHMETYPELYIALNAPNGWGTYETALPWLKKWFEACHEYPNAIIRVSR